MYIWKRNTVSAMEPVPRGGCDSADLKSQIRFPLGPDRSDQRGSLATNLQSVPRYNSPATYFRNFRSLLPFHRSVACTHLPEGASYSAHCSGALRCTLSPFFRKPKAAVRPNQVVAGILSCLLCGTLLAMGVADQPPCHLQDVCPEPVPDELRPWTGGLSGVFCSRLLAALCMPLSPTS